VERKVEEKVTLFYACPNIICAKYDPFSKKMSEHAVAYRTKAGEMITLSRIQVKELEGRQ